MITTVRDTWLCVSVSVMELPRVAVLLSIEDELGLEVDFLGASAP